MNARALRTCCLLLALACAATHAQEMRLTTEIPPFRMPAGPVLPAKYGKLATKWKDFAWLRQVTRNDEFAAGNGWERIDGSSIHSWFAFARIDVNNDGWCDWYVDASAPMSTGGDDDTINTLYLGKGSGWSRIGATLPDNKPDELGFGKAYDEQDRYLFGEEPAVIHDAVSATNYIVTALYSRHVRRYAYPGYRILAWDAGKNTLRPLDKWEPGSKAAAVYAFFKAHGAYEPSAMSTPPPDRIIHFDPEVESYELDMACDRDKSAEEKAAISPHLLAQCKRQR
jgi:hypothetical protein